MVKLEDKEFEDMIIKNGYHIAVPFELVFCEQSGDLEITSYSFCEDVAHEFEKRFSKAPFSEEARAFLYEKLTPVMEKLGYNTDSAASRVHLEFRADSGSAPKDLTKCEIIDTLDRESWDKIALDEFYLDSNNPYDRMAVVRKNGQIVCYAGLNDEIDNDGLAEITVECEEQYRRQGYGSACVAAVTDYLESCGRKIKYICREENIASVKTAERAGLKLWNRSLPFICRMDDEDESEDEEIRLFEEV